MKKIINGMITFLMAVAIIIGSVPDGHAYGCELTLTSPPICKIGCETIGSVSFSHYAGTVLTAGDWWFMDLPYGVYICEPIDYLIVGNASAGAVDIGSGTTAAIFNEGTSITTMATGTSAGPLSVSDLGGGLSTLVSGGDIAIRVRAEQGSQRVWLEMYGSSPTATITVGNNTTFSISILNGDEHPNYILHDTNDDGIYGNDGPGGTDDNTLIVNSEDMPGNLMFVSLASFHDFLTFTGDSQIAHVIPCSPIANAGPDQVVFDEVTLDGSQSYDPDPGGTIESYEWQLQHRDNSAYDRVAEGVSPVVSGLSPGFYDVTLTVTDNDGDSDSDTMLLAASGVCEAWPQPNADLNLWSFNILGDKPTHRTDTKMSGEIKNLPHLSLRDGDTVESRITIELFGALHGDDLVISDEATLQVKDRWEWFLIEK